MKFYRVSHHTQTINAGGVSTFVGPYVCNNYNTYMLRQHNTDGKHSGMYAEFLDRVYPESLKKWVCGFTSMDAFRTWFEGWEEDLRQDGFVLRVYDVPDYIQGDVQAITRAEWLDDSRAEVKEIGNLASR